MSTITIDGTAYQVDDLAKEAEVQLARLQFISQEFARLQVQTAAMQTARIANTNALKARLPPHQEKIQFS